MPYPSRWYGYAEYTEFHGFENDDDELMDIWAIIDYNAGRPYIEIYDRPDYTEDDTPLMSMWLEEDSAWLRPDIGDEDAWILDQYLTEDDEFDLLTLYMNGKLDINFEYGDETRGCACRFYIREEGTEWEEPLDSRPPGYEIYGGA